MQIDKFLKTVVPQLQDILHQHGNLDIICGFDELHHSISTIDVIDVDNDNDYTVPDQDEKMPTVKVVVID